MWLTSGLFGLFIITGAVPSPKFHCQVTILSVNGNVELFVKLTGSFSQVGEENENLEVGTDWATITCFVMESTQYLLFVIFSSTVYVPGPLNTCVGVPQVEQLSVLDTPEPGSPKYHVYSMMGVVNGGVVEIVPSKLTGE